MSIDAWTNDEDPAVPAAVPSEGAPELPDAGASEASPDGVALIAAERARQIAQEGWTPEHDAEHTDRSLAKAAACYVRHYAYCAYDFAYIAPHSWPWSAEWWKPNAADPIRDLAKAGALIAAEIDRLQRAGGSDA